MDKIKKFSDIINESKISYKRKYTESYPSKNTYTNSKIKTKMLDAVADGIITNEEFNKILSELNANSRWVSRNSHLFKMNEEGVTLSKIGKIIREKSKNVNESAIDWPKQHDKLIYDLEQNLSQAYEFEDKILGYVTPQELNKYKKATKKLEDAIRDIINAL